MVQVAFPANTEFPGVAWVRWIMPRARAVPSEEVRLVREPITLPSSEAQEVGKEILGPMEGGRREPRMHRCRLTWPTLRRREITSWPM